MCFGLLYILDYYILIPSVCQTIKKADIFYGNPPRFYFDFFLYVFEHKLGKICLCRADSHFKLNAFDLFDRREKIFEVADFAIGNS